MTKFPPATIQDIRDYDIKEVIEGFTDYQEGIDAGENRSHGYRWGYQNAKRDQSDRDDGFDELRRRYARSSIWPRNKD